MTDTKPRNAQFSKKYKILQDRSLIKKMFYGQLAGAVMALPFSVLCEIVGTDCLYSGFAFFMMVTSIAVLVTPPIAGKSHAACRPKF